jgi:hypothetical protein
MFSSVLLREPVTNSTNNKGAQTSKAGGDLVELKVEVIAIEASGNKAITEEPLWEAP